MARDLTLILEDDLAEVIEENGDVVWSSDEDDNFDFDFDQDEDEIIEYLVRAEVIESEKEIGTVSDSRDEASLDNDGEFDDGDDDLEEIETD